MNYNFYANILESKQHVIGDPYFYQTKEEIENWLKEMKITKYVINDDLTIDVNGDVNIGNKNLKALYVKFRNVSGDFDCADNQLTSLEYCPEFVEGSFYCYNNQLKSLNECPKKIGKGFYCSNNQLKSLEGCPEEIGRGFYCYNNELISLKYFPVINGNIVIYNNPLESLEGLENISVVLLIKLIYDYPKLDWREIEWDKIENINEIVSDLYENIENKKNIEESKEALKRIEELQLY